MISRFYDSTINIYRNSGSIINNVYTETSSSIATVSGTLQSLTGNERYVDDKKEKLVTYRLFCEVTDVDEDDYLSIDDTDYEITFINKNLRNNHYEIDCFIRE